MEKQVAAVLLIFCIYVHFSLMPFSAYIYLLGLPTHDLSLNHGFCSQFFFWRGGGGIGYLVSSCSFLLSARTWCNTHPFTSFCLGYHFSCPCERVYFLQRSDGGGGGISVLALQHLTVVATDPCASSVLSKTTLSAGVSPAWARNFSFMTAPLSSFKLPEGNY